MTENSIDRQLLFRILILAFVVMLMLSAIIIRLWTVQILSGHEFDEKASRQYARGIRLSALRGRIYSSDGRLLAGNRPCMTAVLHLSEMPISGKLVNSIHYIYSQILRTENEKTGIGRKSLISQNTTVYRPWHFPGISKRMFTTLSKELKPPELAILYHIHHCPGIPLELFRDLSQAELAKLSEITPAVPGLELTAVPLRIYPYRSLAAQIIGYTVFKDPRTAEDRGDYFYYSPEMTGRAGLEKSYNSVLQGKPGRKDVNVNHRGFVYEVIGDPKAAGSSSDLVLTLDARLQVTAEHLLHGREGAIVVMDASDGSLLAAASAPGYDLNDFIPRISTKDYNKLKNRPGHPFQNKVMQGTYMPGSIIKPLVALAILENGISPDDLTECDGATHFPDGSRIRCWAWRSGGHGPLSLLDAIKYSCNDFFIENGTTLGIAKLKEFFASAGIGSKTGLGMGELPGIIPDPERFKKWNVHETALVSIGQGKIQISPLQAVCYMAAIANGGKLWAPRIVRNIRNPETGQNTVTKPVLRGQMKASEENIAMVREGMFRAVNESDGGANRARVDDLKVIGKTGTAEVGSSENRTKNTWFIGYAQMPTGRQIAVAVLVLKGEAGNRTAAPLAAEIFRTAMKLDL